MTKLTERAKVKQILKIALSDTLEDDLINDLIEHHSAEVERITRRSFAKAMRTEYYQSYDQLPGDPEAQNIWLNGPVDLALPFTIVFAQALKHDTVGLQLSATDYLLNAAEGHLRIGNTFDPVVWGYGQPAYAYDPQGFKITYTGGYAVTTEPDSHTDDPLDDFGVVQVPAGLKMAVAGKVARDFATRVPSVWTDEERASLRSWTKKDMI